MKIGLTGGIASGKSTVLKIMNQLGIETHSADEIVAQLHQQKEIQTALKVAAGEEIYNPAGELNKSLLKTMIFNSESLRNVVNNIIHPAVIQEMEKIFMNAHERRVCIEVPLLFEANLTHFFDKIIVVSCSETSQLNRLMERDQLSRERALKAIESQWPLEKKRGLATLIIDSDKPINEMALTIKQIIKNINDN